MKVKSSKWLISGLVLATLTLGGAKIFAADQIQASNQSSGVLAKTALGEGNYCHLRFPAIRPSTLGTDQPQLKSADTGDVIDYYGPCDHDPAGNEQVLSQSHAFSVLSSAGFHR
jgi:hypothetical protein